MPRSIADIRKANGGLENLTDEDILHSTFETYKNYYPSIDEYAAQIGYGGAGRGLTGSRISAGIDQYQAGLLGLGGAVARGLGAQGVASAIDQRRIANEDAAAYAAQRARDLGGVEDWQDVSGVGSGLNYLGGLAAQSLPYAGEALAGGLVGRGLASGARAALRGATTAEEAMAAARRLEAAQTAGAVGASYPSSVGDILSSQREAGGENLSSALLGGVPYSALNAFGVEGQVARGMRPLVRGEGGIGRRMLTGAASGIAGEGLSETGQEMINQYAGRMAVDPNETLFNEAANKRYLDSFIGGAALGGFMGGLGGIRGQRPEQGQIDLTQPAPEQQVGLRQMPLGTSITGTDAAALMGSPYSAANLTTPTLINQETDLTQPLGASLTGTDTATLVGNPLAGANLLGAAPAPTIVSGETKPAVPSIFSALDEEMYGHGIEPTKTSRGIYQYMVSKDIDPTSPEAEPVLNALAQRNNPAARKELGRIIRSRSPRGTTVPVVSQPAASVGVGGPVVQGAVGAAGPNAPVQGAVAGSPAAAGAAPQQTSVLPSTAPQPTAPIVTPATPAVTQAAPVPGSKYRRAPKPMSVLEAANAAKAAQAQQAETQGSQAPAAPESDVAPEVAAAADKAKAELVRVFGERDTNILYDAFVNKMPHADIATKYGVGRTTVVKVAGDGEGAQQFRAEKLKAAGSSEAALRSSFDVLSQATRQQAVAESDGQDVVVDKDLKAAGLGTIATEGGAQGNWQDNVPKGAKVKTRQASAKIAELRDALNVAEENEPDSEYVQELRDQINALESEYVSDEEKMAGLTQQAYELLQQQDALQEKIQAARDAGHDTIATKNGKVSLEEAEGDATALQLRAEKLLKNIAESMELAKGKTPKDTNAVQIESTTGVSVQPKAQAGQGVGKQVRSAKKPATESQAKVPAVILTEAEQAAQAWDVVAAEYPTAPKFADLTKDQQQDFIDFGPDNWGKEDVQLELTKLARAAATLVGKEETIDAAVNRILRMSRQTAPLFSTDLYLGKENVAGQPQYGRELRNPVTLANGIRLDGFTSLDQSVFSGYDRNGQRVTLAQSAVKPEDVMSSRDSNRTANAVKAALGTRRLRLGRGDTVEVTAGSVKFDGAVTDEASLRRFPGVDAALRHYEKNDLRHVLDAVEVWMVAPDSVDFDAAIMIVDGKQTVAVRSGVLTDTSKVEWAMHHELGHIADDANRSGGIYSSAPELNLGIRNGKVMPMGKVVREIADFIKANPNSGFAKTMAYPMDHAKHSSLSADETRMEVFAQLWAMFNTRDGKVFLDENLPNTFDFMEINDEAAKQNKGGAGTQAGAATQAAGPQVQAYRGAQGVAPAILRIARPRQGLIDRNIDKLPKVLQQPAKNIVGSLGDLTGSGLDYVVFTSDLIGRAVKAGIPAAQKFATALANSKAAASVRERRIEKIADMFADIEEQFKGSGAGTVNEFLFESTRTGKWGYGKYRNDEMGARFDALGPKAQAFVKAVFAHGDQMSSEKKQIVLNAANSEYDAMIAAAQKAGDTKTESELKSEKAATLKRFQTLFKVREGLPYAPIRRTGPWAVISRSQAYMDAVANNDTELVRKLEQNPDHHQVSFVGTKNQARSLEAEIGDQFSGLETTISKRAEAMDDFSNQGLLPALTAIRSKVDSEQGTSNTKLLNIISQLYLESLAEDSARKSEMRRRGISGQVDMLSSFTTQGRADANFLASVQYSPEIQDALQQMRKQSKLGDRERKSEIFDELSKRYVQSLDYNVNPWISKLTGLSSKYFLATSPGYYIQNLTQPFMMSVPAMAGKHDYATVGSTLWKAYSELGPLFKTTKLFDQQFDFSQVPDDVKRAVDELVQRGKIDIGLATEINEYKVEADNNLSKFASKLNKGMRLAVQKTEAINRLSTAMAAYRLEIADGRSHEEAVAYADRILTETHGDYTAFNAPRIFNSNFGKIALQFRKFQLVQMAFYAKLFRDAFTNPAERKAALRTLGYSVAHNGVFAGALGIPGYAAVAALASALFGSDDEPYDLTEEMRKALGPEWSQLIMRGAPTLIGMDLSGKIGAGQMLSVAPFMDIDLTTQRGVQQAIGAIAGGATGGMAGKMLDGLSLMMSGDIYRGLEQTLPKGIADMLKAGRLTSEGLTRRNGDVLIPEKDVSEVGALWAAMGLPSSQVTETYQRLQYAKNLETNFTERSTKIRNEYAKAYRNKDSEGMAQARAEWTKLQQARVRNELKAQPMSSLIKAPQAQVKREKKFAEQLD